MRKAPPLLAQRARRRPNFLRYECLSSSSSSFFPLPLPPAYAHLGSRSADCCSNGATCASSGAAASTCHRCRPCWQAPHPCSSGSQREEAKAYEGFPLSLTSSDSQQWCTMDCRHGGKEKGTMVACEAPTCPRRSSLLCSADCRRRPVVPPGLHEAPACTEGLLDLPAVLASQGHVASYRQVLFASIAVFAFNYLESITLHNLPSILFLSPLCFRLLGVSPSPRATISVPRMKLLENVDYPFG